MKDLDIKDLLPQRDPILMVDCLVDANADTAHTTLTIRPDNFFLDDSGRIEESGIIEHIAQSASAFAGYMARQAGATEPPVGYIGEVKNLRCIGRPKTGDELHTTVTLGTEVAGVRLLTAETRVGTELVATTQMKIAMQG